MSIFQKMYELRAWVKNMPRYIRERAQKELRAAEYMRDTASSIFVIGTGAEYPAWGADDSRTAVTPGAANNKLVYQIESLFRDVLFKETHLVAAVSSNATTLICPELLGAIDTYYDGAYVQNFTRGTIKKVTSYVASTKTLTVPSTAGQAAADLFSVFNINGSAQINHAAIDAIGAAGGDRAAWLGAFSVYQPTESGVLISQIAAEAGLLWFRNYENKETLLTLDDRAVDATITADNVLEVNGIPQIKVYKTSTDDIANDFKVNYRYDHIRGGYSETETLDHKDTSLASDVRTGFRDGYATYTALCAASRTKYKVDRPMVVDLPHVRDAATAELKLKQLADLHALQRYIVEMDLVMDATTVQLEEGDYIAINHALLPAAISDSAAFVIVDWVEIPESQTYHIVCQETPWGS
jgi:hypothetical protein